MSVPFVHRHRVEFFETDLAGIVHFANFYRYMEQAEHALFRSLGLQIHGRLADGTVFGWPRVSASCSFHAPARYEDELEVRVSVVRRTSRSLTTAHEFHCRGKLLAIGEMKTAYCVIPRESHLESVDMPNEYAVGLDRFLKEKA